MVNGLPVIFHLVLLQLVHHSSASAYGDFKGEFGWGWGMDKFPGISGESESHDLPSANFDKPDKEVHKYFGLFPRTRVNLEKQWRITYLYH
ncbi:hypothetical protein V8C34DRAFT_261216 [Trichoderma compactum]